MPQANLNRQSNAYEDALDSIVIVNALGDIPGGRTLDVENYSAETIKAGHVIGKKADGTFFPVAVSGNAYAALSEGEKYAGILKASILTKDARAGILTIGQVKEAALPYPVTDEIKTALKLIQFV